MRAACLLLAGCAAPLQVAPQVQDQPAPVDESGFVGGLTVFREGNSSFVPLFRIRRSQIYAEMSLDDFIKNLNTFAAEPIK